MLRQTLLHVVEMVRNECALSSNSSRGIDHADHIAQIVSRTYQTLAEDYDWEHLQLKRDAADSRKTLNAGQRYYDFPVLLNVQKISRAWVKWGTQFEPLDYGITVEDYNSHDSDDNTQRVDPVRLWDFYGHAQFEVWPIPASNGAANGYQVAFEGQKIVEQLTGMTSRLDIDHILVALGASVEILTPMDDGRAKIKASAFSRRLATLRGSMGSKERVTVGLGRLSTTGRGYPRHPTYIR